MAGLPTACGICSTELCENGVPFATREKGSNIGATRQFVGGNVSSSCDRVYHSNAPKRMVELSGFEIRPELAEYPTHTRILSELWRYVDTFVARGLFTFSKAAATGLRAAA